MRPRRNVAWSVRHLSACCHGHTGSARSWLIFSRAVCNASTIPGEHTSQAPQVATECHGRLLPWWEFDVDAVSFPRQLVLEDKPWSGVWVLISRTGGVARRMGARWPRQAIRMRHEQSTPALGSLVQFGRYDRACRLAPSGGLLFPRNIGSARRATGLTSVPSWDDRRLRADPKPACGGFPRARGCLSSARAL